MNDMQKVYDQFFDGINFVIKKEEIDWMNSVFKYDPIKDHIFTYIYYSNDHTPKGYLTYEKQTKGEHTILNCINFAYSDREGLLGLLNFIKGKYAYYDFARIKLPDDINLGLILSELNLKAPYNTNCNKMSNGMVRVVNVECILQKAAYHGSGCIRIQIKDTYLPVNTALWIVSYENGNCVNIKKEDIGGSYDLAVDIADFSRLICGGIAEYNLPLLARADINCSYQTLQGIFYEKRTGAFEYF